jgi:hypothetical protein
MPINYLNLYLLAVFGGLAATLGGIVICYAGISESSYLVYRGMELTTYYLDKNKHDLYVNGLIYSITFGIAFLLLLAVIVVPSPGQIQQRMSTSQFAGSAGAGYLGPSGASAPVEQSPTTTVEMTGEEDEAFEIELEPDIESFDEEEEEEEEESALSSSAEDDDSDVVYGTGRITDKAHRSFILSSPDSAVKFLMRKELDGRPLKSSQDEIYEGWQTRGLSRGKLRKHYLKIMEWDSMPEMEVNEIYNKLKDKVYEVKHSG